MDKNHPNMGNELLALPEAHHHVSRLLVLVIFVAVIGLIGWAYVLFLPEKQVPDVVVPTQTQSVVEQPVALTPQEIAEKKILLDQFNNQKPVKLTPKEAAEKKAFLERAQQGM